jgi:hypothetical protein
MSDSESSSHDSDPVMLVITDLLKPGPLKIARITKDFTLPRLIPVVTLLFSAAGAIVGLLAALIIRSFIFQDSLEVFMFGLAAGAGIGWMLATVRLDGQEVWKWAALRFSAASQARTRINNSPTRIVAFGIDDPPPPDSVLVASNYSTNVYAVSSRVGRTGRVYTGIAPVQSLVLGEVTILASTVRVQKGGPR